jgi:hypothetical protein
MRYPIFVLASSVAVVAGCAADSTAPGAGGRSVTVSFVTSGTTTTSGALVPTSGVLALTSSADALVITKAELVVARAQLQRAGGACTSNTDAGDGDREDDNSCEELELAPTLVTLPVQGTVANALNVTVPAGTYSALEAKIRPVRAKAGNGSSAFLTAHPDLAGVSVRVQGTFNGKAFTYTGSPKIEFKTSFNPPIVVDSTGAAKNITISVDLANWFKNSSGALIDPSTANTGGANAQLVADNIRRSFKAFRDDDRKGREDRGSHS